MPALDSRPATVTGISPPSLGTSPTHVTASITTTCPGSWLSIKAFTGHHAPTVRASATISEDERMSAFTLTIDGKPAATLKSFTVVNPADESEVAACPEATVELVDEAVASARRALPLWAG